MQARLESREGQATLTRLLRNVSLHRRTTVTSLASASATAILRSEKEEWVSRERRETVELRSQRSHSGTGAGRVRRVRGKWMQYLQDWCLLTSRPGSRERTVVELPMVRQKCASCEDRARKSAPSPRTATSGCLRETSRPRSTSRSWGCGSANLVR